MACIIEWDMPEGSAISATAAADELLRHATDVLADIEQREAAFEAELAGKRDALRQLVERDRAAVIHATERLNELYRTARAIADNKGRREVLESILRQAVPLDPERTFDDLDAELRKELRVARGITGAMRVPDIGRLLNQAAVQVDHLEERADQLEARLREASAEDDERSPARLALAEPLTALRNEIDAFAQTLPLSARSWNDEAWSSWTPPQSPTPYVRYGRFTIPRVDESGVPALLALPGAPGLVVEPARKRDHAVDMARALALRALAAFPPGQLRLRFIDPKGLGESASPFLHLVDRDEGPVGPVLTREHEIEELLEQLLAVADRSGRTEEAHLVVVFDHPIGLSARGIGLLRALTEAGPSSRVCTVIVKDARTGAHPREARTLPALQKVRATKDGFEADVADARRALALDPAPPAALYERVGACIAEARAVVTTFAAEPAPEPLDLRDDDSWWDASGVSAMLVPFGAAQAVDLAATAALIAVEGDDSASTTAALHDAIVGLATRFSPNEVQLHLVGLDTRRELEPYAQRRLPHARLVGIAADRELAVSALEAAHAEVARRLVLFQAAGVIRDGYRAYRQETTNELPRIVVFVDDANQLFGHEDQIEREARELLSSIALDGATTGVHVVLVDRSGDGPSVTDRLAPVTTHAVALDTSREIDLDDLDQAGTLRALRVRADQDGIPRSPTIVDGARHASLADAPIDLLREGNGSAAVTPRVWLGEPTRLGSPVETTLQRGDGANLAIVTPDDAQGQGMLAACLVSAAIAAGTALELHVLDFMPLESGFSALATALQQRSVARIEIARRRQLATVVDALRNQVVNRLARPAADVRPCILAVNGLHRADALTHDDPSRPNVVRHLQQIVHEGPNVSVHTVIWSEHHHLEAMLGPNAWHAFRMRAVGRLDAATSTAIVESEVASTLSPQQAVLYDETRARLVRFRPYELLTTDGLSRLLGRAGAAPGRPVQPV